MSGVVLAFDTSLVRAGIAALSHDEGQPARIVHLSDVGHGGSDSDGYPQRRRRIRTQMHALAGIAHRIHQEHTIELVVIEGPMYGMKTLPSHFDRAILWGGLCDWLDTQGLPIAVVPPATREKFITGIGSKGDKPRVLAEMRSCWCPATPRLIANHDQADALGLATMGAIHLGWPMPFRLRRCHVENVHTVVWPNPAAA